MSAFGHVTALLSFVYALALTHLLARIAELFVARDRVKFSGLLANLDFLKTANAALFFKQNLIVLPMFIPTVLGVVSTKRWIQWAVGLIYLAMLIGYTVTFYSTLS